MESARKPLPVSPSMAAHLKEDMRDHLAAVEDILAALMREDFAGVAKAGARLGYSEAVARNCRHMGEAAPGFGDAAINFHRTADAIGEAARQGDHAAVLEALGRTLKACVDCHASYRQEVVDLTTWQRLTRGEH
jgi:cytochrome c556